MTVRHAGFDTEPGSAQLMWSVNSNAPVPGLTTGLTLPETVPAADGGTDADAIDVAAKMADAAAREASLDAVLFMMITLFSTDCCVALCRVVSTVFCCDLNLTSLCYVRGPGPPMSIATEHPVCP